MAEKTRESILETIKRLMIMANDAAATKGEVENAHALAAKLMAKHQIAVEEVTTELKPPEVEQDVDWVARWDIEHTLIHGIIAEFYFVLPMTDRREGGVRYLLYGDPENVEVGRFVWHSMLAQMQLRWMRYRLTHNRPAHERRIFVEGLAKGYSDKMRQARREAEREFPKAYDGSGTEIVLAACMDKLREKMLEAHPDLRLKREKLLHSPTTGAASTRDAGYKEGKELNLNKQIGRDKKP